MLTDLKSRLRKLKKDLLNLAKGRFDPQTLNGDYAAFGHWAFCQIDEDTRINGQLAAQVAKKKLADGQSTLQMELSATIASLKPGYSADALGTWSMAMISLRHAEESVNEHALEDAALALINAAQFYGMALAFDLANSEPNDVAAVLSQLAKKGAIAKLSRDPKQGAKAEAFRLWNERRAGKHPRLRTNEQFATECMRRWPVLKSSAVITGWCTEWNKAAKAGKS